MSTRAYNEANFHINWHVKDDNPLLTDLVESQVQRFLRGRVVSTRGMFFHEVGGTDTHVHVVVSGVPAIAIPEWIGQLKGSCSHFINHEIVNRSLLAWHPDYGFVTFGTKDLPWVLSYVRNQRQRHADGNVEDRLERTEPPEEDQGPPQSEARRGELQR